MKYSLLNGVKTYVPQSPEELMCYAMKHHKIMIAVNAEKILHATDNSRIIINRNLGYPDGIGAVWALRNKGIKNVIKIPGCELWLDIIKQNYKSKTFYAPGEHLVDGDISDLISGVYFYNINTEYGSTSKKFIVQ